MSGEFNTTPPRHLARSSREKMWAGVAGGLGEYFDLDPTLVRIGFVAATLVTGGLGVPVYLVLWFLMPRDDRPGTSTPSASNPPPPPPGPAPAPDPGYWYRDHPGRRRQRSGGLVLIALGLLFLAGNLGWFHWINGQVFWPVILVILGVGLLLRHSDWRF